MAVNTQTLNTQYLIDSIGPQLTEDQARAIFALGPDAVIFALMTQAKMIGDLQAPKQGQVDPYTPSSHIPPYQKASRSKRAKPKGAQPGHQGHRRQALVQIDQIQDHRLTTCPDCLYPFASGATRVLA